VKNNGETQVNKYTETILRSHIPILGLEIKFLYSVPHLRCFAFSCDVPTPTQRVPEFVQHCLCIFLNLDRWRSVHVGFLVVQVALKQILLRFLWYFLVSVLRLLLTTHFFLTNSALDL